MKTLKELIHQWRNKAQEPNTAYLSYLNKQHDLTFAIVRCRLQQARLSSMNLPYDVKENSFNSWQKTIDAINNELELLEMLHELNINQ